MITQPANVEVKALRYLEEHNVQPGHIMKVLREQFEMPWVQAERVARRSKQSLTNDFFVKRGGHAA